MGSLKVVGLRGREDERVESVAENLGLQKWADVKCRPFSCELLVSFPTRVSSQTSAHPLDTRHVYMHQVRILNALLYPLLDLKLGSCFVLSGITRENVLRAKLSDAPAQVGVFMMQ